MDSIKNSDSCINVLRDKICDLERKLTQSNQNLKTKENLIKLQQQQMHKIEEMYKKCLEDSASVHCEHKRTLHDLENLKIILRSYENKSDKKTEDFECQIDMKLNESSNENSELINIKFILDDQNEKTNKILELLKGNNSEVDRTMCDYIGELVVVSQTLKEVVNKKAQEPLRELPKLEIEKGNLQSSFCSSCASCKTNLHEDWTQSSLNLKEKSVQLHQIINFNASQNIPERRCDDYTQTNLTTNDFTINTKKPLLTNAGTDCQIDQDIRNQIGTQNYLQTIEDLTQIKSCIHLIEEKLSKGEDLLNGQNSKLYQKLNECFQLSLQKDFELNHYKDQMTSFSEFLENHSLNHNFQKNKVANLNTQVYRLETIPSMTFQDDIRDAPLLRQKICSLEMANEEALLLNGALQGEIDHLRNEIDAYEESLKPLDELMARFNECGCASSKSDSSTKHPSESRLYKRTINDAKNLLQHYKRRSDNFESLVHVTNLSRSDAAINTDDTKFVITLLKTENEQLVHEILQLKKQMEKHNVNKSSIVELQDICAKLSKNLSEVSVLKKENASLKDKVNELTKSRSSLLGETASNGSQLEDECENLNAIRKYVYDQVDEAHREIDMLRIDNEYLVSGLDELRTVLRSLEKRKRQNVCREVPQDENLDCKQSNFETEALKTKLSHLQDENCQQGAMLEDLKALCQELNEKLVDKMAECEQLINEEMPKLNSEKVHLKVANEDLQKYLKNLQNDLDKRSLTEDKSINTENDFQTSLKTLDLFTSRIDSLGREFVEFKICTQMEEQQLIKKYEEIVKQTDELCQCLDQYKQVNDSLLKSHYDLEKGRDTSCEEFQNTLEENTQLKAEIERLTTQKTSQNKAIGTERQDQKVETEKIELTKQNTRLRQDNCNLRQLIKEQEELNQTYEKQIEELTLTHEESVNENIENCAQCQNLIKNLECISIDLKNSSLENASLKCKIHEMTYSLSEKDNVILEYAHFKTKYQDLVEEMKRNQNSDAETKKQLESLREQNESMRKHLECENEDLRKEMNKTKEELNSCLKECDNYSTTLKNLRKELKNKSDSIDKYKESINKYEGQCTKHKEEIRMLQEVINKVGGIKEKYNEICTESEELRQQLASSSKILKYNETLIDECQRLETTLKEVTRLKESLEGDYRSYMKTNEMIHEDMSNEIKRLNGELVDYQNIKQERDSLVKDLEIAKQSEKNSRDELTRVLQDFSQTKNQLEDVTKRIEAHLQEHLEYKVQVEKVKSNLEEEIKMLRGVLQAQNMQIGQNELSICVNSEVPREKQVENLESFIRAKEIDIKRMMEHRSKALDLLNHLMGRQKSPFRKDNNSLLGSNTPKPTRKLNIVINGSTEKLEQGPSRLSHESLAVPMKMKLHKDIGIRRKSSIPRLDVTTAPVKVTGNPRKLQDKNTTSKKRTCKTAMTRPL